MGDLRAVIDQIPNLKIDAQAKVDIKNNNKELLSKTDIT